MTNKIIITEDIEFIELNEGSLYDNGFKLGTIYKDRINIGEFNQLKENMYVKIKINTII